MKLKKVLAVTLAAAMTLSLAACGGGDTQEAAPAPAAESSTEEAAPAADSGDAAQDEAPAADAGGVPTYSQINLDTDYKDLTATLKWLHHKTDRAEDGTIDAMIANFNAEYPNITVEP